MIGSRPPFRVGQKVRPSREGIAATLFKGKKALATGRVVKVDRFNCPTVLWEGRKTATSYHPDFIDPVRGYHPQGQETER